MRERLMLPSDVCTYIHVHVLSVRAYGFDLSNGQDTGPMENISEITLNLHHRSERMERTRNINGRMMKEKSIHFYSTFIKDLF